MSPPPHFLHKGRFHCLYTQIGLTEKTVTACFGTPILEIMPIKNHPNRNKMPLKDILNGWFLLQCATKAPIIHCNLSYFFKYIHFSYQLFL